MIVLAPVLALLALAGPGVLWTRDYTRAFADAEEQRRPLLLFFRADCGGGNQPQNPTVTGPVTHQEGLSDCDLMQQDVWEAADIIKSTERYVPVVVDGGDRTLQVRYQAVRMPTTLVTDPWGNEVFRTSGYIPRDKMARILEAVPRDFSPLAPAGRTLKANPTDMAALVAAAQFYGGAGLPQVSERLFAKALSGPRPADATAWRQAVIARGLNLIMGLKNPAEAAQVFEAEITTAPDAPGSDALMLGVVNARLEQGRRKEAESAVRALEAKYPGSPYAARARQNLTAAGKP